MKEIIGWSYKTSLHQVWSRSALSIAVFAHLEDRWYYSKMDHIYGTTYSYDAVVATVRGLVRALAHEVATRPDLARNRDIERDEMAAEITAVINHMLQ